MQWDSPLNCVARPIVNKTALVPRWHPSEKAISDQRAINSANIITARINSARLMLAGVRSPCNGAKVQTEALQVGAVPSVRGTAPPLLGLSWVRRARVPSHAIMPGGTYRIVSVVRHFVPSNNDATPCRWQQYQARESSDKPKLKAF